MTLPVAWERRRSRSAPTAAVAIGAAGQRSGSSARWSLRRAPPAVFAIASSGYPRQRPAAGHRRGVLLRRGGHGSRSTTRSSARLPGRRAARDGGICLAGHCPVPAAARPRRPRPERRAPGAAGAERAAAVAANRARAAGGLDSFLRDRIEGMAAAAAAGREQVFDLIRPRRTARSPLSRPAGGPPCPSCGTWSARCGKSPSPSRSRCSRSWPALLELATSADARLQVEGSRARCRAASSCPGTGSSSTCWRPCRTPRRPASTYSCGSPPMRLSCGSPGRSPGRLIRPRPSPWSGSAPRCWAARCGSRARPARCDALVQLPLTPRHA